MKAHFLTALTVLTLAATGSSFAANETHDHGHGTASAALQLNVGKKWETDAPLRKAMGDIRQSMASSLHVIHQNKLSAMQLMRVAIFIQPVASSLNFLLVNLHLAERLRYRLPINMSLALFHL